MPISNLSNGLRTGVCTSTNRPTTPYEGQVIYETDTDKVFVWNGTAWVIPNSPAQNPQGLELITTCTVTSAGGTAATASGGVVTIGTSNTSVTVSSAFSSTYDNYRIVVSGGVSVANAVMQLTLGSSVTGYYSILNYASYAAATVPLSAGNNNSASWDYVGYVTASSLSASFDLINPFAAKNTQFHAAGWTALSAAGTSSGVHQVATSYTAFTLSAGGNALTGGTIRVYGYRNS